MKVEVVSNLKSEDNAHVAVLDNYATASFDFKKILPCPHLRTGVVNYKRQVAFHTLRIYESKFSVRKYPDACKISFAISVNAAMQLCNE